MKYMLLVYSNEQAWTREEWTACTMESSQVCQDLHTRGQFHGASPLHSVATAKTVRIREGQRLVTDGPFAETHEQLGGYFLIDVPNLDDAIAVAARLPAAKKGVVEIRPLFDLKGLPPESADATGGELKVMLLCYDDEPFWHAAGPEVQLAAMREAAGVTHELASQHKYLSASPLHPSSTATSVRIRDGRRLMTDGPFAETREVLGGYYLLKVRDLNEALDIAARHPGARVGSVEVRPVYELDLGL